MSDTTSLDAGAVLDLVVERVRTVLDLPAERVTPDSRFDEDLHADSLDLVEVVESVERVLGKRGITVSLPDDELLALTTVGEAAHRIAAAAGLGEPAGEDGSQGGR